MQFALIVTTLALSTGISTFAVYERAVTQQAQAAQTRIEMTEMQSEMMMRAIRRQVQLDPSRFSLDGEASKIISSDEIERAAFGNFTPPQGLISYSLDSAGNVTAILDPLLYDRGHIEEGVLGDDGSQHAKGDRTQQEPSISERLSNGDLVSFSIGSLPPSGVAVLNQDSHDADAGRTGVTLAARFLQDDAGR